MRRPINYCPLHTTRLKHLHAPPGSIGCRHIYHTLLQTANCCWAWEHMAYQGRPNCWGRPVWLPVSMALKDGSYTIRQYWLVLRWHRSSWLLPAEPLHTQGLAGRRRNDLHNLNFQGRVVPVVKMLPVSGCHDWGLH